MDLRLVEIIRLGDEIVGDIAGGIDVDVRLADALEEPLGLPCPRSSQAKAPEAVRRRAQVDRENNANPGIAGVKDKSARERSGNVKSGFHPNDQKAKGKERSRADRRGRREIARRARQGEPAVLTLARSSRRSSRYWTAPLKLRLYCHPYAVGAMGSHIRQPPKHFHD